MRDIAQAMVNAAFATDSDQAWRLTQQQYEADASREVNLIQQTLDRYAATHSLKVTGARDFTQGYRSM